MNLSSDSRKKIYFYLHYGHGRRPATKAYADWGTINVRWRLGQRFQTSYQFNFNNTINDVGFVDKINDDADIYFAIRKVYTLNNVWSSSYIFNLSQRNNLSFRAKREIYYMTIIIKIT